MQMLAITPIERRRSVETEIQHNSIHTNTYMGRKREKERERDRHQPYTGTYVHFVADAAA